MKFFAADLHVHTALSPCADDEMTPPAIVAAALFRGIAMIAVCDHNSAGNAAAVRDAAGDRLAVIAGMEITTAEEIHVLGLFPDPEAARAAASVVMAGLPPAADPEGKFGRQPLMDPAGAIVGAETKMLAAASLLPLGKAVALIHNHGGLAVAAHINRPSYSVLSQLGLFPEDAGFDAVEVFIGRNAAAAANRRHDYGLPVLNSSDGHFLEDVGRVYTNLYMEAATFPEAALALRSGSGRRVGHA